MQALDRYFPELTHWQRQVMEGLYTAFEYWNQRINVISRKDFPFFYLHHVLHSLVIAKLIRFDQETRILDAGTGGGFPGIPLAILFTDVEFLLVDSTRKKLQVVDSVARQFGLSNVQTHHQRIEHYQGKHDFVISRALTRFPRFVSWVRDNVAPGEQKGWKNGIFYLKGGDLHQDIQAYQNRLHVWNVDDFFEDPYFQDKKVLYLPLG